MQIKPLHNKIVIKPQAAEEMSEGGIYIPDSVAEKPAEGKVIAVGPGTYEKGELVPVGVNVGDYIIYAKNAGSEIVVDDESLLVLEGTDVIAILEK